MWNVGPRRWKGELIADLASTVRAETSFSPLGTLLIALVESRYISLARFLDRGSYIAFAQPDYEKYRDTLLARTIHEATALGSSEHDLSVAG